MKTYTVGFLAALKSRVTTLATCWKLTRTDGVVMGFTDHEIDLVVGGTTYAASSGYTRSAIQSNSTLAVDNMELEGIITGLGLSDVDIRAGVYDYAEVLVFLVDYTDTTLGTLILRRGHIGELTLKDGIYVTEIRGLSQAFTRTFVEVYTHTCQAQLGDARCKYNLAGLGTDTGTVGSVTSGAVFTLGGMSTVRAANFYRGGLISFTSGLNAGRKMEVKEWNGSTITLFLPMPFAVAPGDAVLVSAGCDKSLATCANTFNNILNFRGFPHIPGLDRALQLVASTGSSSASGENIAHSWALENPSLHQGPVGT